MALFTEQPRPLQPASSTPLGVFTVGERLVTSLEPVDFPVRLNASISLSSIFPTSSAARSCHLEHVGVCMPSYLRGAARRKRVVASGLDHSWRSASLQVPIFNRLGACAHEPQTNDRALCSDDRCTVIQILGCADARRITGTLCVPRRRADAQLGA